MPTTIGRNSSVTTGSTRDAAPIRRRDDDAPGAARQLVDHAERQAAERGAQDQHVGHQVRLEELRRVHEPADQRDRRPGGARDEEPPLVVRKLGYQLIGRLPKTHISPLPSLMHWRWGPTSAN